jgi:hypothetical protein
VAMAAQTASFNWWNLMKRHRLMTWVAFSAFSMCANSMIKKINTWADFESDLIHKFMIVFGSDRFGHFEGFRTISMSLEKLSHDFKGILWIDDLARNRVRFIVVVVQQLDVEV